MAASPKYKVYRDREYVGCTKYAEDAAALVGVSGGVVKYEHHTIVWREGAEEIEAAESYDQAATIMLARVEEMHREAYIKAYGALPERRA